MPRRQDIPDTTFDLLVDLRLRIQSKSEHPAEVKKTWYEEAKERCGPRTAQFVLWLFDAQVTESELRRALAASSESPKTDPIADSPANGVHVTKPPADSAGDAELAPGDEPGMSFVGIIREGVRAVPSVKYAVGVAAIAAVVALVVGWKIDLRIALAGVVVMFVLMTALLVFAGLNKLESPQVKYAAIFMMWVFVLLITSWASLLTSSVFFNAPKTPADLFGP